jgi:hypothetical protein
MKLNKNRVQGIVKSQRIKRPADLFESVDGNTPIVGQIRDIGLRKPYVKGVREIGDGGGGAILCVLPCMHEAERAYFFYPESLVVRILADKFRPEANRFRIFAFVDSIVNLLSKRI